MVVPANLAVFLGADGSIAGALVGLNGRRRVVDAKRRSHDGVRPVSLRVDTRGLLSVLMSESEAVPAHALSLVADLAHRPMLLDGRFVRGAARSVDQALLRFLGFQVLFVNPQLRG